MAKIVFNQNYRTSISGFLHSLINYICAALRYSLHIAYDGTDYSGWQLQPNALTVQEEIEAALSKVLNTKTVVQGCGRTDAGVHALDYVLHFDSNTEPQEKFIFRMNQILPRSIAVKSIQEQSADFHARFDALERAYIYKIDFAKNPFLKDKSWHLYKKPDIQLMNDCCSILLEYDDFASFCKSGADNKTTICNLMEAKWIDMGDVYEFHIKANRFLRNMVRAIVGTMIDVGYKKTSSEEFRKIIELKDRTKSGKSAPACGLYLSEVKY
ncbi:MAG: tRNA pseudouridine(38-40) synthase TruA [Bacteroidia bacterium]